MSDPTENQNNELPTTEIMGVTVTSVGGGYYDLSHPTLKTPERVRGREAVDQRVPEIAKALGSQDSEGVMEPQGEIPSAPIEQQGSPRISLTIEEISALVSAQVAEQVAKLQDAGITTVVAPKAEGRTRNPHVGRKFDRVLSTEERTKLSTKMVDIQLEESDEIPPTGLFISHNGKPYMIKPGEPVTVPEFLVHILDDATMSAPVVNAQQKVVGYRPRMKYPYRRL